MSADLFAEFGKASQPSQQHPESNADGLSEQHKTTYDPFSVFASASAVASSNVPVPQAISSQPNVDIWGDMPGPGVGGASLFNHAIRAPEMAQGVEEDDWGEFESAPSSVPALAPTALRLSSEDDPGTPGQAALPVRARVVRVSTIDMMNNRLVDLGFQSPQQVPSPRWAKPEDQIPTAVKQPKPGPPTSKPIRKSTEEIFNNIPVPNRLTELNPKAQSRTQLTDPNILFDVDDFRLHSEPDDDDGFGGFEDAHVELSASALHKLQSQSSDPFRDVLGLNLGSTIPGAAPPPPPPPPPLPPSAMTGSTRRAGPPSQLKPLTGGLSPIAGGLSPTSPYPPSSRSPSFQERNPYPGLELSTKPTSSSETNNEGSPVTAWPALGQTTKEGPGAFDLPKILADVEHDVGFRDYGDRPPAASNPTSKHKAQKSQPKISRKQEPSPSWDWDPEPELQPTTTKMASPSIHIPEPSVTSPTGSPGPPPTNIPPPSVLLPIIQPLLRLPVENLLKPSSRLSGAARATLLTHPRTIEFLRAHIALTAVTAHILAGRRHRWSRDRLLASKMTISRAGSKGMKLSSIDKTESQREAREVAEVVDVWKQVVGPLRSACAGTGTGLRVPEIAEVMAITTVKGGMSAHKPCVVCGLKREERVSKVDVDIEDSFGEWWVDHWGHRTCRNFWVKQENELRSR